MSTFLVYKVTSCCCNQGKSPDALPNFAQRLGHLCPRWSVKSTRALGRPCSCFRSSVPTNMGVERPGICCWKI